jgi:hypothetical protein
MSPNKKVPTHFRSVVSSHAEHGRHGDTPNREQMVVRLAVAGRESGECA